MVSNKNVKRPLGFVAARPVTRTLLAKGAASSVDKESFAREPRGTRSGGRFASRGVSSEPSVALEGETQVSTGELDGSKAREELARRREEAIAAERLATEREAVAPDPNTEIVLEEAPTDDRAALEPIRLGGAVEHDDGTWNYPPPPSNDVESMAKWWATLKIFDGALENISNADETGRDEAKYQAEFDRWRAKNPGWSNRQVKKDPAGFARLQTASRKQQDVLDAVRYHSGLIPRAKLRDCARLGAFYFQSLNLGEQAQSRANEIKFELSDGTISTAREIVGKYRLSEIQDAYFGRVKFHKWVR